MPHKHKRKHNFNSNSNGHDDAADDLDFDLPPEKRARPLAVRKNPRQQYANDRETFEGFGDDDGVEERKSKQRGPAPAPAVAAAATQAKGKGKDRKKIKIKDADADADDEGQGDDRGDDPKKRKKGKGKGKGKKGSRVNGVDDDTPKQFARMMAWQARLAEKGSSKDRGTKAQAQSPAQKGGKHATASTTTTTTTTTTQDQTQDQTKDQDQASLKIKPGESLSAFSQRVNRTLSLAGIPKAAANLNTSSSSSKNDAKMQIPKDPLTRHNKHLQRMQTEWRNAEAKIRAQREEEEQDREDEREEHALLWGDVEDANAAGKKGKKKKRRRNGEDDGGDVWKVLLHKRKLQQQQQLAHQEGNADGGRGAAEGGKIPSVAGLTASQSVQAPPLPQSKVRTLDVDRIKRMFRVQ